MDVLTLSQQIKGKLIGNNKPINGFFNLLSDAKEGDVVIRHWVDETGIKIASEKNVSCFITQDPRGTAQKIAEELNLSLIIVDKIELANAFALKWTINEFARDSVRLVVTGTNGKSTTTHIIYNILKEGGFNVFTNTDSKSEFNTLIDPMVAKKLGDYCQDINGYNSQLDYVVIEVSEVQGWFDKVMHDHALLMTRAIQPEVVVITNVAMDHIGLVNSIEEAFKEISGAIKALDKGCAILNQEDPQVMDMQQFLSQDSEIFTYGNNSKLQYKDHGIFYKDNLFLERSRLPFTSSHFIQNTLAAISACIYLEIPMDIIKRGVYNYKPLKRRFSILNTSPTIIDDFAHNPEGIKATIKSTAEITSGKLWIVCAIRGSRGDEINLINSKALVEAINEIHNLEINLIITNSAEAVDQNNTVKNHENRIFVNALENSKVNYSFYKRLDDSLRQVLLLADENDTILLIGAQGMDTAEKILNRFLLKK
ncbi:Mur ligase family protein [Methanobacterium alcaliphilum]|uniref:Mur ligase family protein n=1 Tax=Methanobacterium alcaliphilum TaxID=392018 RepID=UPI003CCB8639